MMNDDDDEHYTVSYTSHTSRRPPCVELGRKKEKRVVLELQVGTSR